LIPSDRTNVKYIGNGRWSCGPCVAVARTEAARQRKHSKNAREAYHNSIGDLF